MQIDSGHIYILYADHGIQIPPRVEDFKMHLSANFRFLK